MATKDIRDAIQWWFDRSNEYLANSYLLANPPATPPFRLQLAAMQMVDYPEDVNRNLLVGYVLNELQMPNEPAPGPYLDEVHPLRNIYCADLVQLWMDGHNPASGNGCANLASQQPGMLPPPFLDCTVNVSTRDNCVIPDDRDRRLDRLNAFSVIDGYAFATNAPTNPQWTTLMVHEIAHNFGARHQRFTCPGGAAGHNCPAFAGPGRDFAHGVESIAASCRPAGFSGYADIMGVGAPTCGLARSQTFSNPNLPDYMPGCPLGVGTPWDCDTDNPRCSNQNNWTECKADVACLLKKMGPYIANNRETVRGAWPSATPWPQPPPLLPVPTPSPVPAGSLPQDFQQFKAAAGSCPLGTETYFGLNRVAISAKSDPSVSPAQFYLYSESCGVGGTPTLKGEVFAPWANTSTSIAFSDAMGGMGDVTATRSGTFVVAYVNTLNHVVLKEYNVSSPIPVSSVVLDNDDTPVRSNVAIAARVSDDGVVVVWSETPPWHPPLDGDLLWGFVLPRANTGSPWPIPGPIPDIYIDHPGGATAPSVAVRRSTGAQCINPLDGSFIQCCRTLVGTGSVPADCADQFVVSFESACPAPCWTYGQSVYLWAFDKLATPLLQAGPLNPLPGMNRGADVAVYNGRDPDEAVVTWLNDTGVVYRRLRPDNTFADPLPRPASTTPDVIYFPKVAAVPDGFFIVWPNGNPALGYQTLGIQGRRFDAWGQPISATQIGLMDPNALRTSNNPQVAVAFGGYTGVAGLPTDPNRTPWYNGLGIVAWPDSKLGQIDLSPQIAARRFPHCKTIW